MTLPNFLIIGVAKAGTTALWYYMKQHPEIYMSPVKEPGFFAYEGKKINFKGPGYKKSIKRLVTELEDYKRLFENVTTEKAIGEASPFYLMSKEYGDRIKRYIPGVKLIACLRNPADRAFSNYLHLRREGRETLDFETALSKCEERISKNYSPFWDFIGTGFYYEKLKHYFDLFGREKIRIYLYDDFKKDNLLVLKDIFTFLEVDKSFIPRYDSVINDSFIPKNRVLHRVLKKRWYFYHKIKRFMPPKVRRKYISLINYLWENNKYKTTLSENSKQELIEIYREDILKTQKLIGKDLSAWLR